METLEELDSKIDTARDLRSVVKTMKALAALSIRHFQDAVDALTDYHRAVELGLQIALRHAPESVSAPGRAESGRLGLIIIGSDQGMCGQFNEDIAAFSLQEIRKLDVPASDRAALAVGLRIVLPLEQAGQQLDEVFSVPASLSGVMPLVREVLLQVDEWHRELGVDRFLIFHSRPTSKARYLPSMRQLLPVDRRWLEALAERAWGARGLPMFSVDWNTLFSSLIRQHLLVSVYRSVVESLAAENASRMASMQAAERNIDERLQDLCKRYHQQRQSSITAELLDIVGGFEALSGMPH